MNSRAAIRAAVATLAALLATAALLSAGPAAASAPTAARPSAVTPTPTPTSPPYGKDCSANSSPVTGLARDAHPVILVHGWTGGPMGKTRTLLEKQMTPGWQFLLFDYHDAATRWADAPQVAGCLADYILKVSQAHHDAGGDGRVYFVAHSMGGLAVRFASAYPGVGDHVAGMVTLDTPHAGSPWGAASNDVWARLHEVMAGYWDDVPASQGRARTCLAVHHGPTGMPAGCAVAPYLPGTTPIAVIGGNLTIRRTVFGFLSYQVPTGGDTIVTMDSSQSYFDSAPSGRVRQGTHVYPISVACDQDFNGIVDAAAQALSPPVAGSLIGGFFQLQSDNAALGDIVDGSAGVHTLDVMIAANLVPNNCSHSGITTNPDAINQTVASLRRMAATGASPASVDLSKVAFCGGPCKVTGSVPFTHPTWGPVTLFTLLSPVERGPASAVVVDATGRVRWKLPQKADDRLNYEWAPAKPAIDKSGLIFINYNPGRYNGITTLQPVPDGMRIVTGWYLFPYTQDLYYADLQGPADDGYYRVLRHNNDCVPDCASGTITTVTLKWNGTTFAPQ